MPRILLVCDDEDLTATLQTDPRCEVVRAHHWPDGAAPIPQLGDPAQFDIIVHRCTRKTSAVAGIPTVHDRYLEEATALGAVTVEMVTGAEVISWSGHLWGGRASQRGYTTPVLTPSGEAAAVFVAPFVDDFARAFGDTALVTHPINTQKTTHPRWSRTVLATNQYEQPLIVASEDDLTHFAIPDVSDQDRAEVLHAFLTRCVFALHPRVLADSATSSRVTDLRSQLGHLVLAFHDQRATIERAIADEEGFVAEYAPLAQLQDEALKVRVKQALETIFGLDVVDLDEEFASAKNADLYIPSAAIVVDVRGAATRNARRSDVDDVAIHAESLASAGKSIRGKLLLFNGQLALPRDRRSPEPFGEPSRTRAITEGVTLMTGADLLARILLTRTGNYSTDSLLDELRMPGPVAPLASP